MLVILEYACSVLKEYDFCLVDSDSVSAIDSCKVPILSLKNSPVLPQN